MRVRIFAGNPYDGHVLGAQLEQTGILLQDVGRRPREVIVDLGFLSSAHSDADIDETVAAAQRAFQAVG